MSTDHPHARNPQQPSRMPIHRYTPFPPVGLSDLLGRLLLPGLMARLRAQAPNVALDIVHL